MTRSDTVLYLESGVNDMVRTRIGRGFVSRKRGKMKLEGKVALVTGASRGIGRSHALRLARLGADIVVNARNLESSEEFGEEMTAPTVMEEVQALGVRCIGIQADVGKKDQVEAMLKRALDEFGHIDIRYQKRGTTDRRNDCPDLQILRMTFERVFLLDRAIEEFFHPWSHIADTEYHYVSVINISNINVGILTLQSY